MPATASAGQSSKTDRRDSPTRMMVLWSVVLTLAVTLIGTLIIWAATDVPTAASAFIGAVFSISIFAVGLVAIRGILAGPTQTTMAGAFFVLLIQLGITAGALVILSRQSWIDMVVLGIAFIAAGIVFQVGAVTGAMRARTTVDPAAAPGAGQASATVASDAKGNGP